jgi:vancomycin resistance protein VanW
VSEPTTALVARDRLLDARRQVREKVPFSWRVALRRAPHRLAFRVAPPSTLPTGPELPVVVCERASPLRRPGTTYEGAVQAAKEANVARAARALHGRVLAPGEVLSWHAHVGPPVRSRGFVDGPELHDGRMALGPGGGLCQVANLVFWLAVHGGLLVLERHRHDLDLFPDDARDVPFGLGATVFWPHRDLVLSNPHPHAVRLGLELRDGALWGRLSAGAHLGATWGVREADHRFRRSADGIRRENRLYRWRIDGSGHRSERLLAEHSARLAYPVRPDRLEDR